MLESIPVVYVAGTGRSGSTLVGGILASLPGVVSVGEVRHIWTRGMGEGWRCGCGEPFKDCPFWAEVLAETFPNRVDLQRLQDSDRELLRLRTSRKAMRWARDPSALRSDHGYYLETVERLYGAIAKVAGARAIVDSSKVPTYGAMLSTLPNIDLRVLHLIRDPRAAAYSALNPKLSPDRRDGALMDRVGAAKSAVLWTWWNRLTERLWPTPGPVPVMRTRYETLVGSLESTLNDARDRLLPELANQRPAVTGATVRLGISHSISGNPDRMRVGSVVVRPDERWISGLAPHQRVLVLALAGWGMKRYGYRWRGRG
ncbi:MAG: sulfotransferase [Acidimicrobiia bacterium]